MCGLLVALFPLGVGESDVVQVSPSGEDPFLGDEPVVVPFVAVFIPDVRGAFVRSLRFVVVVGQPVRRGLLAGGEKGQVRPSKGDPPTHTPPPQPWKQARGNLRAVAGRHHPVNVEFVAQLDGDHHGKPAGAQPRP